MSLNLDKYQHFAMLLANFHQNISKTQVDISTVMQKFTEIKQYFQQTVIPVTEEEMTSLAQTNLQSYRTEMSKQIRLLEMDILFLKGARQEKTIQTRNQSISDRLNSLIRYCEAMKVEE
ncbi:MAG: heterocyst frequency control protein PatD [Mastigocoleus sp.]